MALRHVMLVRVYSTFIFAADMTLRLAVDQAGTEVPQTNIHTLDISDSW